MEQRQGQAVMPQEMRDCESLFCTLVHYEETKTAKCKFCSKEWDYTELDQLEYTYKE